MESKIHYSYGMIESQFCLNTALLTKIFHNVSLLGNMGPRFLSQLQQGWMKGFLSISVKTTWRLKTSIKVRRPMRHK